MDCISLYRCRKTPYMKLGEWHFAYAFFKFQFKMCQQITCHYTSLSNCRIMIFTCYDTKLLRNPFNGYNLKFKIDLFTVTLFTIGHIRLNLLWILRNATNNFSGVILLSTTPIHGSSLKRIYLIKDFGFYLKGWNLFIRLSYFYLLSL